jgi:tyrosinase
MLFSTLFSAAAVVQVALSKPASGHQDLHHHHAPRGQRLEQRADGIITTGAVGLGDNQVHSRLEINDLSTNRPDMWSLYIRALAKWKEVAATDDSGYYRIAGIHGVPRDSWNGVEQCDSCKDADGYCTHDSVLFPAWHRAFMALFEQELIKVALEVADGFDGDFGDRLKAAAQKLRAPYWDWACKPDQGSTTLPPTISGQQVTIEGPNGDETVDNPLYSYHFEDPSNMYYSTFTTWTNTMRYPTSDEVSATSQDSQAVSVFSNIQENMQDQVYQLLTACQDYLGFATDDTSNNACANSLEGIHNTIHTAAGGAGTDTVSGGHMTYLPLAAFDPIFFVHHANVDRIFALWQTANPDHYGASQVAPHATWTIASGSTQNADSPLMPFRRTADTYWTTNEVKDFEKAFHYSYPEFLQGDQSRATIINYINALYSSTANETCSSVSARTETGRGRSTNASAAGSPPRAVAPASKAVTPNSAPDSPSGTDSESSDDETDDETDEESDEGSDMGINIGPLSIDLPFGYKPTPSSGSAPYAKPHGAWNGSRTGGYAAPSGTGTPIPGGAPTIDPAFIAPNGSVYQYQCDIKTPRYAFNGSYIVYVFDGQPSSDDTSTWLADEACIGQLGILGGGEMTGMGIISSGSVPVTRHLQKMYKQGKLEAMSEDVVVPYMTENLNWKIVYRGEEVPPESLTGYKASFLSGLLSPVMDGELPSWSDLIPHVDVTKGKAGGITEVVDGLLGGVGDALGGVGDALGGTLGGLGNAVGSILGGGAGGGNSNGGDSSEYDSGDDDAPYYPPVPNSYGSASSAYYSPQPTGYAPHSTEGSPVLSTTTITTSSCLSQPSAPPEEDITTTVYTTEYVTYCPCIETLSTAVSAAPSATAYAQAY